MVILGESREGNILVRSWAKVVIGFSVGRSKGHDIVELADKTDVNWAMTRINGTTKALYHGIQ